MAKSKTGQASKPKPALPATQTLCSTEGIAYTLTRRNVKNINLRLHHDGSVLVSAHPRVPQSTIDAFVAAKQNWIAAARQRIAAQNALTLATPLPSKEIAAAHFERLSDKIFPAFAAHLNGQRPTIKVRAMRTRWGVCHITKRQITFALQLYNMPPAAQIYVVVHEYCHFLVPNHSAAFWREVAVLLPDWKVRRALLRTPPAPQELPAEQEV